MTKKYALIVAGGSGKRMGTDLPKQFLELEGKPILFYTIEQFLKVLEASCIFLVLPTSQHSYWNQLKDSKNFNYSIHIVPGGESRYESVKNGLVAIKKVANTSKGLVAIHDGVRPFITPSLITQSFQVAENKGSAIACIPLKDSIRKISSEKSEAVPRLSYRLIQTPQTFQFDLIWQAFEQVPDSENITDDASVFEQSGKEVFLIEGSYYNIKITTPEDLLIAEAFIKNKGLLMI